VEALTARLRAPVMDADAPAFIDAVERRLPGTAPASTRRWRAPLVVALSALAAATVVVVVGGPRGPAVPEYTARGTPSPWHALVSTSMEVLGAAGTARPLRSGERLVPGDGIAVSARNGNARQAVYLMVFAVDARDEVHWIVPAWTDAAASPRSVELPPGGTLPVPSGTTPESPAAGKLRVLTLLTRVPLDVRAVESTLRAGRPLASGSDRHLQALEVQMAPVSGR
jgi:hypothetical protein